MKCFKVGTDTCSLDNSIKPKQVFVGIPSAARFRDSYEYGIKQAIAECGLSPWRAEEEIHTIDIMCNICLGIQTSKYAVINITDWNPNVLFELGLAYGLGKTVVLVREKDSEVPADLRNIQDVEYQNASDLRAQLSAALRTILGKETAPQPGTLPTRSAVRCYLYSKSRVQYQQNHLEAAGYALYGFRKPDLFETFGALLEHGQPDTTVVNLDEYWVKELAKRGKLEDLSKLTEAHSFFHELIASGTYSRRLWSNPHFMDLSYYSCLEIRTRRLVPWLNKLSTTEDTASLLDTLKSELGTGNLLVYDFRTPDTYASVVLEFVESFGSGINSLWSRRTLAKKQNLRAIKILRGMVGDRPEENFMVGEPRNFDFDCETAPFIRCWHSRMSDMPKTREKHIPILQSPIRGTLGGWHLGILADPPSLREGQECLAQLLKNKNQKRRFETGAGLPTLAVFYETGDLARQLDPITSCRLDSIGRYAESLIRRSMIPFYPLRREQLGNLHHQLMTAPESEAADVFDEWLKTCARRRTQDDGCVRL